MYGARLEKLLARMVDEQLDAMLVTSLPNIFYLSGFTGSTAILLITPERRWFLTDFRYHEQVGQQVDQSYELIDNTGKKLVEDIMPQLGSQFSRVGFEGNQMAFNTHDRFSQSAEFEWVSTNGLVEGLRLVKDESEIELIRQSQALSEKVLQEVFDCVGPDVTEADLAAEYTYRGMKYGALKVSFDPIIASGVNSSKPHAGFTTQKLVPGTPLTFDVGLLLNGYTSDMTRTVFFKDCPPLWDKVYGIVKQAKDLAFAGMRAGKLGKEIDAIARTYIDEQGYAGRFGHGLGHGLGIEVHEAPRLAHQSESVLAAGNVVSNEPGIYLPGEGGVRIEDLVVIRDDGAESLNTLTTELTIVG